MYCKYCGQELNDQAVVCTNCGCSVKTFLPKKKKTKIKTPTETPAIYKHLNIVCFVLAILSAIIYINYVPIYHGSTYNNYFSLRYEYNVFSLFLILAFLSISLITGVWGLVKKSEYRLYSIIGLIISVCTLSCTFFIGFIGLFI